MITRVTAAPFWPAPPRPPSSADPVALDALTRLLGGPSPAPPARMPEVATEEGGAAGPVRAGGRIVGVVLPYPPDGGGPIYTPARGPALIRELLDEGIID